MRLRVRIAVLTMSILISGCICYTLIVLYAITDSTLVSNNEWTHVEPFMESGAIIRKRESMHFSMLKRNAEMKSNIWEPMKCSTFNETPYHDIRMFKMYQEMNFDNINGGAWKQGWNVLASLQRWSPSNKLKVFVMPHSHNDPGWKLTFEEYFGHHTKNILDNMVVKLSQDSRRKFIWAEVSFFSLWWDQISDETKNNVKKLLSNGQLEIVTGGWVMNDEANTHYYATLQQLMHGHQWLWQNINYTSRYSWQIDPFGHSPVQPYLLKKMKLEGVLIQRTHYIVKKHLAKSKSLEFRWTQTWDTTGSTGLLTHMMPFYSYDIPHTCGPDPKICCQFDFRRLSEMGLHCPWGVPPQKINSNNVAIRAEMLLDQYRKKAELFATNVLLAPLGDDFRFDVSREWDVQYENYQKIFDYLNSNPNLNVEIQFGTLSDYFDAVKEAKSLESFPSLSGDFFTYADREDHYWSGYFTSRPFYKRMDRELINYLRTADMIFTFAWQIFYKNEPEKSQWLLQSSFRIRELISKARGSLSLFQHHDGITGTAKDYVVIDYADKMLQAIEDLKSVIQKSAYLLLTKEKVSQDHLLYSNTIFFNLDDSRKSSSSLSDRYVINLTKDNNVQRVVLFNSLTFQRRELISLKVTSPVIKIANSSGHEVEYQINPICRKSFIFTQCYEVFFVADIGPLELKSYFVMMAEIRSKQKAMVKVYNKNTDIEKVVHILNLASEQGPKEFLVQNDDLTVAFSESGFLKAVTLRKHKLTLPIHLNFIKYRARHSQERSGAYLFLPEGEGTPIEVYNPVIIFVDGPLLSQVHVYVESLLVHTIEIYHFLGPDEMFIGIKNIIEMKANNAEIAMLFSTSIANGDIYYTDLNGLQMVKRQRLKKLPLQALYYPMASAGFIEDGEVRMTLVSAQPLGASSIREGQFEVMQDRRLMQDDNLGLGQGVTDNVPTISTYRLLVEKFNQDCQNQPLDNDHALSVAAYLALSSLLYPVTKLIWNSNSEVSVNHQINLVDKSFPPDIHIVSLATISSGDIPTAGLVLHRTHLDTCFNPKVSLSDGKINLTSIVSPKESNNYVYETTLDFIHKRKQVSKEEYSSWSICVMDMVAFWFSSYAS